MSNDTKQAPYPGDLVSWVNDVGEKRYGILLNWDDFWNPTWGRVVDDKGSLGRLNAKRAVLEMMAVDVIKATADRLTIQKLSAEKDAIFYDKAEK